MSTELIQRMETIVKESALPQRHTFFQLEKFNIGREPTAHGQFWQVIRELESKKADFDAIQAQLAESEDDLEILDINIQRKDILLRQQVEEQKACPEDPSYDLNIREIEINIRKLERKREQLKKSSIRLNSKLQGIFEEISFLIQGYDKLKAVIGNPKRIDDYEAQKEYWNEKILEEFNLRMILRRPIDEEFVKTAMALPDDAPVKIQVSGLLKNLQQQLLEVQKASRTPSVQSKPKIQG